MIPICATCSLEMSPVGSVVTVGYMHEHAPVDYSKAYRYECLGCNHVIFLPIGYSFGMATGEPKNFIPVKPRGIQS